MVEAQCKICNRIYIVKEYLIVKGFGKYCSSKCYHLSNKGRPAWNKGTKGICLKPRTGKYIKCSVCGNIKYFELNQLKKRPCKHCSVKCARFSSRKVNLTYSSIHSRINREWGKADVCEQCTSPNTVDWANISGDYLLAREDWLKLCRKCHIAYDKKNNKSAYKNYINLTR